MQILFLSNWFPYPPTNGSKIRIIGLLKGLARNHKVTLLSFKDYPGADINSPELRSICQEVHVVPRKSFNSNNIRSLLGLFSPTPRFISDTFSMDMAHHVDEILSGAQYDLVIASQLGTAIYRPYFQDLPAIFAQHEE